MKYAFQCIASDQLSDQFLQHMSFLRVRNHLYSLYDIRFTMTTSLSTSRVMARLYLFDTTTLEEFPFEHMPFVMVLFGPYTKKTAEWKERCLIQGVPYFHRVQDKELRDELYVMVISWLIYLVK